MPEETKQLEIGLIVDIREFVKATSERTSLPKKLMDGLVDSDDWSLIIKLHGIIESALNQLVTSAIGDDRVLKIVMRLDTSDKTRGKMAFVKEMELLPKEARVFISKLSELRNNLVHDVSKFDFSLGKWVREMDSQELANLTDSLNFDCNGKREFWFSKHKDNFRNLSDSDLKAILIFSTLAILYAAIDKYWEKFVEPLAREEKRLRGLVESYQAGLSQSASASKIEE
jgi:hypothetical protein